MLKPKHIITSLEFRFWKLVIPLMEDSPAVQQLVTFGYSAVQEYRPLPGAIKALLWAAMGWSLGLGAGVVSTIIF